MELPTDTKFRGTGEKLGSLGIEKVMKLQALIVESLRNYW